MSEIVAKQQMAMIVLVTEDPWVWGTVQRDLERVGFVAHAPNKDVALHIMDEVKADLVIGDLDTLGQEGVVWFEELRQCEPTTGQLLLGDQPPDGVDALRKPWNADALRGAVARQIDRALSASQIQEERRQASRVATNMRALYSPNRASAFYSGTSVNLSRSGARIRGSLGVGLGQKVELMLMPAAGAGVGGSVEVMWTNRVGNATEFGVRFVSFFDEESEKRLAGWVTRGGTT